MREVKHHFILNKKKGIGPRQRFPIPPGVFMFNNSTTLSAESENTLALKESLMTTKELAEVLGVSVDSIQNAAKKLSATSENFPKFTQGQTARYTETQATAIKLELQNHAKLSLYEIANQLHTSYDTIQRHAQKLGFTQNGVKTYLDEKQVTLLLEDIQKTNNRKDLPSTTVVEGASTTLTPALKIKRAMELMQEGYEEELQILRGKVTELTPKAEFFDAVTGSKDCIEIGTTAKVLNLPKIGRNKLFEILRVENVLQNDNLPYQRFVDLGYFRVVESKWTTPNGDTKINLKTIVSQKGVAAIRKLLIKKGYVDITSQEYLDQAIPAAAEKYIQAMPSDN